MSATVHNELYVLTPFGKKLIDVNSELWGLMEDQKKEL